MVTARRLGVAPVSQPVRRKGAQRRYPGGDEWRGRQLLRFAGVAANCGTGAAHNNQIYRFRQDNIRSMDSLPALTKACKARASFRNGCRSPTMTNATAFGQSRELLRSYRCC